MIFGADALDGTETLPGRNCVCRYRRTLRGLLDSNFTPVHHRPAHHIHQIDKQSGEQITPDPSPTALALPSVPLAKG
jgi:hypothetical protein